MENTMTTQQLLKQRHNFNQYNNKKNVYKMNYIFRTYPHIETKYANELAEYIRTNGTEITDEFITFLKTLLPPKNRPTNYNPRVNKPPPRIIQRILDNTPIKA